MLSESTNGSTELPQMKYALVNESRIEASPNASGNCPSCNAPVVARCGDRRVWHWAHRGRRNCDHWWETETEWHRRWKGLFQNDWQEVIAIAEDGEKHIADVRNSDGLVVEFQHSYINSEEQASREKFYQNMVWVVDCRRLTRDLIKIDRNLSGWCRLEEGKAMGVHYPEETFPEIWMNSLVPVLFDYGEVWSGGVDKWESHLLCLLPGRVARRIVFFAIERKTFVEAIKSQSTFVDTMGVLKRVQKFWQRDFYNFQDIPVSCLGSEKISNTCRA
jgi:competence protein CoiA